MLVRTAAVTCLLVATAACSSGSSFAQPSSRDFAPGACHDLAAPVLRLGRQLHGLGSKSPSTSQAEAIRSSQGDVRTLQAGLPRQLAPAVQDLVTAVGVLRLRNDANDYDESLQHQAMTAYRTVVKACTATNRS
jgi:hypothetical protein